MTCPLTIGMATHTDFDGVYFTLASLRAHHPRVEYLVIDNAPAPCPRTRGVTAAVGGRYLHRPDLAGTSAPRDALFRLARTPWVMCLDSHVLLETGAVQHLLNYAQNYQDSHDLLSGPLIYDNGEVGGTHWQPDPGPGLWGSWAFDERVRSADSFEIPMQGLGLFAMRRAAWPGFNRLFRGFGGEEGYIHEKTRQAGGKCLCLPRLRWWHRFRHMEHGAPAPPYRLAREDHVWNLLVGHRELGIDADKEIEEKFAGGLPGGVYQNLRALADAAQPFGKSADRKRMRLLGVWYTNNAVPEPLLQRSLGTIRAAADQTMHHGVEVVTSAWRQVPDNPFLCSHGKPDAPPGHASIVAQIRNALGHARLTYDAVVFLEHDVLYPPNHFDRMGDALANGAPVASNLNYEGLNQTGWLAVKERHEPLHQLAIRRDVFEENLKRADAEARATGSCLLEPQGDRSAWARLQPTGVMPAVHVNVPGRFTSHGEVCYHARSGGRLEHPFWGKFTDWWPLEARPDTGPPPGGCGSCPQQAQGAQGPPAPPAYATVRAWFDHVAPAPCDFHEHMATLRDLAAKSPVCVELSAWLKPALLAMAAGGPRRLVSVCRAEKPEWSQLKQLLPGFVSVLGDSMAVPPEGSDLLFIDTDHHDARLTDELGRWAPHCRHYLVVHCTETYGERGDAPGAAGVLPALRRYVRAHPEWAVVEHYPNNHGLTVLSRDPKDRPPVPSAARQVLNFAKAMARYKLSRLPVLDEAGVDARLDVCAMCKHRTGERCSKCGCPLIEGAAGQPGKAMIPTEDCPLALWPAPAKAGAAA